MGSWSTSIMGNDIYIDVPNGNARLEHICEKAGMKK